jgi:1-acyl-sn-glycerol-3-phosphate acyltransferase
VSARPVGESRADDRPWRRGTLAGAVRDRISRPRIFPARYSAFPFAAPTKPRKADVLPEINDLGIDYDTGWAREPTARVARRAMQETVLKAAVRGLASPTVLGLDRISHINGPVIFAPNHHSHLDIGIILQSIPMRFRDRTLVAAAGDYFFDRKWKAAASALLLNAVPIERKRVSRQSSDQLSELLRDNWNLVIFPEGGRSPDGWGQDFKPGAAFLAIRRGCPVIPIHIEGTDEVLPKGQLVPRRHSCTVTFGAPLVAGPDDDARSFNPRIEEAVATLADEHRSDWWTSRRNAALSQTPSLAGPDTTSWRREWVRTAPNSTSRATANEKKRTWP